MLAVETVFGAGDGWQSTRGGAEPCASGSRAGGTSRAAGTWAGARLEVTSLGRPTAHAMWTRPALRPGLTGSSPRRSSGGGACRRSPDEHERRDLTESPVHDRPRERKELRRRACGERDARVRLRVNIDDVAD